MALYGYGSNNAAAQRKRVQQQSADMRAAKTASNQPAVNAQKIQNWAESKQKSIQSLRPQGASYDKAISKATPTLRAMTAANKAKNNPRVTALLKAASPRKGITSGTGLTKKYK